ncbi:MAG: hypothetical protein AAGF94_10600 [Pseudomonadota bacterium]
MRYVTPIFFLAAAIAVALPTLGNAGRIVAPATIANEPEGNLPAFPVINLINQSGLTELYDPGFTRFTGFVQRTPHKDPSVIGNGGFASPDNFVTAYDFLMDFGSPLRLSRLALWNDTSTQGVGFFTVFSSDSNYENLDSLGDFSAAITAPGVVPGQIFNFKDAMSQYFVVRAQALDPAQNLLNFGEFAFEKVPAPVPLPWSLPLFAAALAALGVWRRPARRPYS